MPAISCGIYGYPLEEAAEIALATSLEPAFDTLDIIFYLFDEAIHDVFQATLKQLSRG